MSNDYWNRPRKERWIRFRKYLENEPPREDDDLPLPVVIFLCCLAIALNIAMAIAT